MRAQEFINNPETIEEGWKDVVTGAGVAAMVAGGGGAAYDAYQASKQAQEPTAITAPAPATTTKLGVLPQKLVAQEPKAFNPGQHLDLLVQVAKKRGLTASNDLANFLGQCKVETNNWLHATEQFGYKDPKNLHKVYTTNFPSIQQAEKYVGLGAVAIANRALANKNGNGDEASGDGWRYRGRGFIHLTGKELYAKAGAALHPDNPNIYVNKPELLSTNPTESAKVAVWYYSQKVGKGKTSAQATKKVNPAGLKKGERAKASQQMKKQLASLGNKKFRKT